MPELVEQRRAARRARLTAVLAAVIAVLEVAAELVASAPGPVASVLRLFASNW